MNKSIITIALMAARSASSMGAASTSYYGFCPKDCNEAEMTAIGSGSNTFIEGAIRLDASVDPLVGKLKGRKITGVRCFLRADYKQKSKGFSCVKVFTDGLEGTPVSKTVNFNSGWNEVYLDSPVEIGDTPLYVGYQVFETQGEPFPLAAYKQAVIPDVCYINAGRKGWEERSSLGALMIEAIIDGDDAALEGHALVAPFNEPLVVAPESPFECSVYVHNQSASEITEVEYSALDADGRLTTTEKLLLPSPIPPYGSVTLTGRFNSPATEGSAVPLFVKASGINGKAVADCMSTGMTLYVSADVFHRVPLIEEFTGLTCTNCPFMFYYLDMALESYDHPHIYVAHHAGFQNDVLTQPCDEALVYLFGESGTYNPAVMYDRRVLQGNEVPVMGAVSVASPEPYQTRIEEMMLYPALAKVLVDSEVTEEKASCRVHGKISKAALDFKDDLYLTVYLLEDEIPATGRLIQWGLQDIPEDAPADLLERFRHRGVIRHCFSAGDNGDKLAVDENGNFSVDFDAVEMKSDWKSGDCEVVAFVHKVNPDLLSDNYVLNAGAMRFNEFAENSVRRPGMTDMRIYQAPDGTLCASDPAASLEAFTITGERCDLSQPLSAGIYIVRWQTADGKSGSCKVMAR